MNVYQWLCVLGIPGLFASLVTFAVTQWHQTKAIKAGVQAILRDRLLQGYKEYRHKGYADEDDRANLENIYLQYHTLGANGVMDDLRDKFLKLPIEKED